MKDKQTLRGVHPAGIESDLRVSYNFKKNGNQHKSTASLHNIPSRQQRHVSYNTKQF